MVVMVLSDRDQSRVSWSMVLGINRPPQMQRRVNGKNEKLQLESGEEGGRAQGGSVFRDIRRMGRCVSVLGGRYRKMEEKRDGVME